MNPGRNPKNIRALSIIASKEINTVVYQTIIIERT